MKNSILFSAALCLCVTAGAVAAQPKAPAKKTTPASVSMSGGDRSLMSRFMNGLRSRNAVVAQVAAVRAGNETNKSASAIARLQDRVALLRDNALSGDSSQDAAISKIYRAMAVSYLVMSAENDSDGKFRREAGKRLDEWKGFFQQDAYPAAVSSLLTGNDSAMTQTALSKAGWDGYVAAITKGGKTAGAGSGSPLPETASLDDNLKALSDAYVNGKLRKEELGEAFYLTGLVCGSLSAAKYGPAAPAPSVSSSGPAVQARYAQETEAEFIPKNIYKKASPAVVLIIAAKEDGSGEMGSGSIIGNNGLVLTNAHVVIQKSAGRPYKVIKVYLKPAKITGDAQVDLQNPLDADIVKYDEALDMALLRVKDMPANAPVLSFGNPDDMSVGDKVAAIGHPEQAGLWTLTTGVISTVIANIGQVSGKNVFQSDVSINRGNSGGPLLNANGNIVGVNTMIARRAADGLAITGVSFSVKADVARKWLASSAGFKADYAAQSPVAAAPKAEKSVEAPAVAKEVVTQAPVAPRTAAAKPSKPEVITESKPYDHDAVIQQAIKDMEDLADEMEKEVQKRAPMINGQ